MKLFAQKYSNGEFHNIYDNALNYRGGLVCNRDEDIYVIELKESNKDDYDYVGWRKNEKDRTTMIFKTLLLLSVCFPYGLEAAVKAGQGEIVYLKLVSEKFVSKAGELKNEYLE